MALEPGAALDDLLERLRCGLGAERAALLVPQGGDALVLRAVTGPGEAPDAAPWVAAARLASAHRSVQVDRSSGAAVAAAPLLAGGAVTGVLAVVAAGGADWDHGDLALLGLLADPVWAAVERTCAAERELSATSALLVSEQRARAVLDTAVDAILTIDTRGLVVSMNPAAERMFGYCATDVVGRNISMLMPAPYREEHGDYLERVLERDELRPRYQPLVDLRTGEVVGTEALLRWDHPHRGWLAPGAFLGLAVELRLSCDIDAWMLRTACGQTAQWGRELGRPVAVWVNLSSQSLSDARLPRRVADALRGSDLPPELLTLEITEDAVMQDAARTVHLLDDLRAIGVQLAVDDFGTGYSSLSYLQQFPVQALKIDRSFVGRLDDGRMAEEAGSRTITRAVVNLASGLRLRTVAEGIETAGQLAAAADLGCDLGQGWFLGRPAGPADAVVALREGVLLPQCGPDTAWSRPA